MDLVHSNPPQSNEFISLSVGVEAACGVTRTNRVFCWGRNEHDALGIGTEADVETDIGLPVADSHLFSQVSAGSDGACALTLGNQVLCWGAGFGPRPVAIASAVKFTSVSYGSDQICGLTKDGDAYCWGAYSENPVPTRISSTVQWLQRAFHHFRDGICRRASVRDTDSSAMCLEDLNNKFPSVEVSVLSSNIV